MEEALDIRLWTLDLRIPDPTPDTSTERHESRSISFNIRYNMNKLLTTIQASAIILIDNNLKASQDVERKLYR